MAEPYKHQHFPKAKYHESGKHVIVKTVDEEAELGKGWSDKPGDAHLDELQKGEAAKPLTHGEAKRLKPGKSKQEAEPKESTAAEDEVETEAAPKPRTPRKRASKPKDENPN